jgi:hypothetical protein
MLSMLLQWPPVAQNFAILSTPWWLVNWGVIIFPPRFPKNMKQSLKNDGETTHSLQNTHIYIHCITSRHVTSHDNACHCITSHALTHIYKYMGSFVCLGMWDENSKPAQPAMYDLLSFAMSLEGCYHPEMIRSEACLQIIGTGIM